MRVIAKWFWKNDQWTPANDLTVEPGHERILKKPGGTWDFFGGIIAYKGVQYQVAPE